MTNACDMEELFGAVVTNRKFLFSSFYGFTNEDVMELFEEAGLPLKSSAETVCSHAPIILPM